MISGVTRGLDPRVHPLRKKMDRRVKPGDDAELDRTDWIRLSSTSKPDEMR
jgi:hypothetical protein